MQCYRHIKEETNVSCGKCDRPICPRCMIPGPAGMRCPECASLRSSALYKINPGRLILATICGLVVGVIGASVLSMMSFFVLFAGPIYGAIVAEVVLRVTGRKRGPIIEAIGVGSIIVGALLTFLPELLRLIGMGSAHVVPGTVLAWSVTSVMWRLLGCGLAASTCYGRLKF